MNEFELSLPKSPDQILAANSTEPYDEQALEKLTTYEAELAQSIAIHESRGNYLDASLLTHEHAELLAMLKQSPAARQLISTAIHLAQKEIELAAYRFELSMEDIEFDPNIGILEAKHDLRAAMKNDDPIQYELVEGLGFAYIAAAEKQPACMQDRILHTRTPSTKNLYTQHERTRRRTIGIDTVDGPIYVSNYAKARYSGALGAQHSQAGVSQFFDVYTSTGSAKLTPQSDEQELNEMATQLLDLPDDPIFIPEQAIPNMQIFIPYHALQQELISDMPINPFTSAKLIQAYLDSAPPKRISKTYSSHGLDQNQKPVHIERRRVCIIDERQKETIVELSIPVHHPSQGRRTGHGTYDTVVLFEDAHGVASICPYTKDPKRQRELAIVLLSLPVSPGYLNPNEPNLLRARP